MKPLRTPLWDRLPTPPLPHGLQTCDCAPRDTNVPLRLIVLTGGPGAGKTAVLAAAQATYCEHVAILPEAATILFGGGFPRHTTVPGRRAAQRAIFHVQREGERLVDDEAYAHSGLCDRGTIDGEAYWPGNPDEYWQSVGTTRAIQLARYSMVVHMRTPTTNGHYNHENNVRIEDIKTAHQIDERILMAWNDHPARVIIEAERKFEDKLHSALDAIKPWLPVLPSAR